MAIAAGVALAGLVYQAYDTEQQKSEAKKRLAGLQKSNYSVSPELQSAYARAQEMAKYGFSPQERAAHQQRQAQLLNTQSQRALDIGGGNMARVISRIGQIANLGANNQFAMQDAQLHRGNIRYSDSLANHIQQIKNMGIGENISQYNRESQAYGNAARQQQENQYQLINNAANLASLYGNKGVNQNVSQPTTDIGANMQMAEQNPYLESDNRAFYSQGADNSGLNYGTGFDDYSPSPYTPYAK